MLLSIWRRPPMLRGKRQRCRPALSAEVLRAHVQVHARPDDRLRLLLCAASPGRCYCTRIPVACTAACNGHLFCCAKRLTALCDRPAQNAHTPAIVLPLGDGRAVFDPCHDAGCMVPLSSCGDDRRPCFHAGSAGQQHCPSPKEGMTVCCDNCLKNTNNATVCCEAGERLCTPDSGNCCPSGGPEPGSHLDLEPAS